MIGGVAFWRPFDDQQVENRMGEQRHCRLPSAAAALYQFRLKDALLLLRMLPASRKRRLINAVDGAAAIGQAPGMTRKKSWALWPQWSTWTPAAVVATTLLAIAVTLNDIF